MTDPHAPAPRHKRSRLPARRRRSSRPAAAAARTPRPPASGSVASRPAPPKSDFPKAEGRTLGEIVKAADSHAELVVSPAALAFYKGVNRYPFGVFEPDRTQVDDADVALYVARVPPAVPGGAAAVENGKEKKDAVAQAREEALEQPAMGPYPAAIESLATKPAFRAQTTSSDPDAATSRLHDRTRLPQQRRVAGRGADQAGRRNRRDAAAQRHGRRVQAGSRRSGKRRR